ncbi:MAG: hypothetical protein BWX60_01063 [Candidatus Marinimicrobia bacterium ADurb.Bin030]|nr:MAG: hypothetical protein BWX60_01063 [Candidatus Marinimicrobia bacterium ADurb.Bin030]
MAIIIAPAGGPNGIDEYLIIYILDGIIFFGRLAPIALFHYFVGAGKQKVIIIVAEIDGNLFPHRRQPIFYVCRIGISRLNPAIVPVFVDNGIHPATQNVTNHFFDSLQPGFFDGKSRFVGKFAPGNRNPDGIEAGGFHGVNQPLSYLRIAPSSFATDGFQ